MFITLEGIEGSGKTSQIHNIFQFLQECGNDCIITREPGGTKIGEKIRGILLDPDNKNINSLTELLLYIADRVQHAKEIIIPALSLGKSVICDRFMDATVVYQGIARDLGKDLILKLHKLVLEDLKPDLTFILDLPPEIGLYRAKKQIKSGFRSYSESRFEEESITFHKKIRDGYLEVASLEPSRFRIINAEQDLNQVKDEIIKNIKNYLKK